ncbi:MurR/RpiR family transcriptional regulator [Nakamurella endophytica]|uniref:RpiR family transcriptional regulator n=1 Tax=Nakamurella endophytica TaxID=1748367 RepID=A0A917WEV2_9ACTN|nr:MurR/RpiR family transcriptional regulator [Nakamurella endophytica]GGL99094.1 RpiR family transcriptional regulator [Nakamurella endophytica]
MSGSRADADEPDVSVAALVRERLATFSPSERKVARVLLAGYPIAGLETVAELAGRANVSPPTVVRFVSRLGFSGHPAFQRALRHELHTNLGSPLAQYAKNLHPGGPEALLPHASDVFTTNLAESFHELPRTEFDAAVRLLCDPRKRVHLAGGRFSRLLAEYLTLHLQMLRSDAAMAPEEETARLGLVADSSKSDVLVIFDYRRYDTESVLFARRMADRGCAVVLLTDSGLSPAADVASVVLPARVESPSPFDSLVPAMAMVEALIASIGERLGEQGRRRLELIERMRSGAGAESAAPSS